MNRDRQLILLLFLVGMTYSVLRYIVFKGVSPEQIPLYIVNKAVSVTGLILIGIATLTKGERRRNLGTCGFLFVLLHVLLSLSILNPDYFAKFYSETGVMHWYAELSLATGALAMVFLFRLANEPPNGTDCSQSLIPGAGRWVLALTAAHVGFMGYTSWSDVGHWPGMLPPITLLAFLLAVGFLLLRLKNS